MKVLHLVGMPLQEEGKISPEGVEILSRVAFAIGENRKPSFPFLRRSQVNLKDERIYFLDTPNQSSEALEQLAALEEGEVALFSDTGMPVLFDAGLEVLEKARALGFEIHATPSAQSWSTACAVCGFEPPFYIEGFLPQKTEERQKRLQALKKNLLEAHVVLMETPYRYEKLLSELQSNFGAEQPSFLAWEIASPKEAYFWGTLTGLADWSKKSGHTKGEFVIILKRMRKHG